jgi:microcystin-dependent protein
MTGPLLLATNPTVPEQAATKAYVDSVAGGGGGTIPTGVIEMFAGTTPPTGFLMCDGSVISRTTYATLFAVIGEAYGAGDGSTTFKLPDLIRRFPLGAGTTTDTNRAGTTNVGASGGIFSHTHTGGVHAHSIAAHTHAQVAHVHDLGSSANSGGANTSASGAHDHSVGAKTTSSDAHSHTFSDTGTDSFTTGGPSTAVNMQSGSATVAGGSHSHSGSVSISISGTTSSDSHSHSLAAFDTSAVGNHSHAAPVHAHDLGNSPAGGATTTGGSGTLTSNNGGAVETDAANPPYQGVNYIIKT